MAKKKHHAKPKRKKNSSKGQKIVRHKRPKSVRKIKSGTKIRKSKPKLVRKVSKQSKTQSLTKKNKTSRTNVNRKGSIGTKAAKLAPKFTVKSSYKFNKNTLTHSGVIRIGLPKSFQSKVKAVNAWSGAEATRLIKKNKPIKGAGYKEPKAIAVIFKIKKPHEKGYYYTSELSPPDFIVNKENVKQFTAEKIADYNNNMAEIAEQYDEPVKPYNIEEVSIRFIY